MISSVLRRALSVSLLALAGPVVLPACSSGNTSAETAHLPYYGDRAMQPAPMAGPADTIFTVPAFTLTTQEGKTITNDTFQGKIYVTDFFFATCPSICPKMQSELLRVYMKWLASLTQGKQTWPETTTLGERWSAIRCDWLRFRGEVGDVEGQKD